MVHTGRYLIILCRTIYTVLVLIEHNNWFAFSQKGDRGEVGPYGLDGFNGEKGDIGEPGFDGIPGNDINALNQCFFFYLNNWLSNNYFNV